MYEMDVDFTEYHIEKALRGIFDKTVPHVLHNLRFAATSDAEIDHHLQDRISRKTTSKP